MQSRTSTRPTYRHTSAQHMAARGGTRRRPSGADTARCSGAHERMHTAMSQCSGPQHGAARLAARRTTQDKQSAADAASAATVSPQRAEGPSALPAVLAVVVVVDAIDLPDSNHRSEAVLEHSRRSGGRKRDVALALLCSLLRRPSRNWRWSRPAKGATKRSASARKRGTADQEQDRSPDWLLRGSGESVGNRDARAVDQQGQPESSPQPKIRPRCTRSGRSQSSRAGTRNISRP